jgi:hypothetical protein
MNRCFYCGEPATTSMVIRVGEIPSDPKKMNTQADLSACEVRPLCELHRARVQVDAR